MSSVTRLLLTTCIAAMLLLPTTAQARGTRGRRHSAAASAQHRAPTRRAALVGADTFDPVTLAAALAERYWGAVPCGGQITVLADQPLAAGMEAATDGWVTFESSLGANDLQAPASSYTQCTIALAHWQWPTRLRMAEDWNMFCLTVAHEMGHLLGHPHSLTPGSVMAPVFTDESSVPTICRQARTRIETDAEASETR